MCDGALRNLSVSNLREVEVGGRAGVVLDLENAPGAPIDTCTEDGAEIEANLVMSGVDGSGLDHAVGRDTTMRLYLLEDDGPVMAIEVNDVHAAPETADSLSRVAEALQFES